MVETMKQKQEALQIPLTAKEIDFRVQSINKGGYATILAYKNARADIERLNNVFGLGFWTRSHNRIDGKEFCTVSVWNHEISQWVGVQDCGSESKTEAEKGQSSDSFKRACFNLGIGKELYDYPVISIKLNQDEFKIEGNYVKQTWNLKLKEWVWYSEFEGKQLTFIAARDNHGKIRFTWGQMKPKPDAALEPVQSPNPQPKPQLVPVASIKFEEKKLDWAKWAISAGHGGLSKLQTGLREEASVYFTDEQKEELEEIIAARKEPVVFPEGCDEYGSLEAV